MEGSCLLSLQVSFGYLFSSVFAPCFAALLFVGHTFRCVVSS